MNERERKKGRKRFRIFKYMYHDSRYSNINDIFSWHIVNDKNLKSERNKLRIVVIKLY